MNGLECYYNRIVRRDLINKYSYTYLEEVPQLKKIILNFGCKNSDIKGVVSTLLSLELITRKRGSLTKSKRANLLLKIRKGNPVGCVVILRNSAMYGFLFKLLVDVFPRFKSFSGLKVPKPLGKASFAFTLKDFTSIKELEKQFYLFTNLPPLNITLVTDARTNKELSYLLQSFKLF
jgi:large subunit ribosomal protein L5